MGETLIEQRADVDREFRFFTAWYAAVGVETGRTALSHGPTSRWSSGR
ncbi:MAG: hypothetical protein KY461_07445 [Actinobacteria bacterium]|nr:hypothetical protein [Actinomycetota bacterium]